jgi:thymidylate synthase
MIDHYTVYGIVAFCKKYGIGSNNSIPWSIKEDLKNFQSITNDSIIIMGKKTFDSLPSKPLSNRINIVLTNSHTPEEYANIDNLYFVSNLNSILPSFDFDKSKKIFIIGGQDIYRMFYDRLDYIYATFIDKEYECTRFFPQITNDFKITSYSEMMWSDHEKCFFRFINFTRHSSPCNADTEYTNLIKRVLQDNPIIRKDRTNTGTFSKFGDQIRFDISKNVPLLTTKRIPWKSCIEELLWFLRGDTNANILKQKNVNIWNDNSSRTFLDNVGLNHLEEGDCGANYSFQWRFFGQEYSDCKTKYTKNTKYDQISNIIHLLNTNPFSRRIFLSAWNPCDLENTVLPPCHVSAQFYVDQNKGLSCHMYQRSCDVFLGLPWNIFSYTVLTYILAKKCGFVPRELIISFGDVHVYSDHIYQVNEQLTRNILSAPILSLSDDIIYKDFDDITVNDFDLIGYFPHKAIKGKMSI